MPTKLTGHMLSNYLKRFPTFSGKESEDAAQWLKNIIDGMNYAEFTDNHKISIISGYLNGDARRWLFENLFVLDSISVFIQEFKREFVPTLLMEAVVTQVTQCVHVLDEIMVYSDNDIKEKQKLELFEDEKVNLDYSNITPDSGDNDCEMDWPEGSESWFIHDQLPQRAQFIRPKQQAVPFNSSSSIGDNCSQEDISSYIKVSSSIVQQMSNTINDRSSEFYQSDAIALFFKPPQCVSSTLLNSSIDPLDSSDIILLNYLFINVIFVNLTYRSTFYNDTKTIYLSNNMLFHQMNHFDWFRTLAVP